MFHNNLMHSVFPPKCAGCGCLLPTNTKLPFCNDCHSLWEKAKKEICADCGQPEEDCRCGYDKEIMDEVCHLTLHFQNDRSISCMVLSALKSRHQGLLFDFIAGELADNIKRKYSLERTIVCNVPRNPSKINRIGYDQARVLAKLIAEKLGVEYFNLIGHRKTLYEQKILNGEKREINAEKNYFLKRRYGKFIKYKNVIVVDDIGTTGASLNVCAKILRLNGAVNVIAATVSKTKKREKKKI